MFAKSGSGMGGMGSGRWIYRIGHVNVMILCMGVVLYVQIDLNSEYLSSAVVRWC